MKCCRRVRPGRNCGKSRTLGQHVRQAQESPTSDTWDQARSDRQGLALLHPTFSETKLGGDGLSTRALPKQQQNSVANFRRNFLAHKNVPESVSLSGDCSSQACCLTSWEMGMALDSFVSKNSIPLQRADNKKALNHSIQGSHAFRRFASRFKGKRSGAQDWTRTSMPHGAAT